jgi:hypothetical protein
LSDNCEIVKHFSQLHTFTLWGQAFDSSILVALFRGEHSNQTDRESKNRRPDPNCTTVTPTAQLHDLAKLLLVGAVPAAYIGNNILDSLFVVNGLHL